MAASLVLLTALGLAAANAVPSSNCKPVTFSVSGTAQNRNITGIPTDTVADLVAFYNAAPLITISGTQTLYGVYCTPLTKNSNNAKLQALFSSITANHDSWQALGGVGSDFPAYRPELYSYELFMNLLGYPTLALDRLGTGKSSHPDPILVVQSPYEESLYNDLAKQIRAGTTPVGKYSYIAYIGNSYGSQMGADIAGKYPAAYDTFILTGFTNSVDKGFVGVSLTDAAPAAVVDPARFGTLSPGYLTTSSQVGRTNSFFGSHAQVAFEDIVATYFFQRKDVVSVGQFASVYAYPFNGAGFTGRVLVLDGENDQPFCGLGSPVLGPAFCSTPSNQLQQTGSLFPQAKYNYKTVNHIGEASQH